MPLLQLTQKSLDQLLIQNSEGRTSLDTEGRKLPTQTPTSSSRRQTLNTKQPSNNPELQTPNDQIPTPRTEGWGPSPSIEAEGSRTKLQLSRTKVWGLMKNIKGRGLSSNHRGSRPEDQCQNTRSKGRMNTEGWVPSTNHQGPINDWD